VPALSETVVYKSAPALDGEKLRETIEGLGLGKYWPVLAPEAVGVAMNAVAEVVTAVDT
jgi:hypothetical protein